MGGDGSGEFGWRTKDGTPRPVLEWQPALDPTRLQRLGMLTAETPTLYTLQWLDAEMDTCLVVPIAVVADNAKNLVRIVLPGVTPTRLEKAPRPKNGYRWWIICPTCGERRNRLYWHDHTFRCRVCHDLRYAIQRDSTCLRRYRKIFGSFRSEQPAWQCHPEGQYIPVGMWD